MPMQPCESANFATARSATEIRAWVVRELAAAMKVDPQSIDTAAPLDTLGVDSLSAIGMTGALSAWLNRDLPSTLMWDYSSLDELCAGLVEPTGDQASLPQGVMDFQPAGDRLPIFFFPGVGGHPVTFKPLSDLLGANQPCYGLAAPGLFGEADPMNTVEEIAAAMLAKLRQVQPSGPYQIAGYCFGGLLAFEAAQQLIAAGETVQLLAIYDAATPAGRVVRPRWQRLALHAWLLAKGPRRMEYLRGRFRNLTPAEADAPEIENSAGEATQTPDAHARAVAAAEGRVRATAAYRPRPYPGSMLLFRSSEHPDYERFYKTAPDSGWGAFAAGGVKVFSLPGTHRTMLDSAHAPHAANLLRPYLAEPPRQPQKQFQSPLRATLPAA